MSSPRGDLRPTAGHDRLLDTIKSVAVVRVILWHTWSWPWLSWIPAMPTMFFANGALLESSLQRRGWLATVGQRARRLLIPYWFYAVWCWVVMVSGGWRPDLSDALRWLLPLSDPIGSTDHPGLWIPLWYIRAYIWFVLLSGIIEWLSRRLGHVAVVGSGVASMALWWWSHTGHHVPFAVGDAIGYLPFVIAGMVYRRRGAPPHVLIPALVGVGTGIAAVWSWRRFGPLDAVVNRSYLLMLLVGSCGILLAVAMRRPILDVVDRSHMASSVVRSINKRALTIYLWQGFGLITAQHLVEGRIDQPVLRSVLSILVVTLVVSAAAVLFGPIEDVAAGRSTIGVLPRVIAEELTGSGRARARGSLVLGATVLVVAVLVQPLPEGFDATAPLSGRAVVARAGMVADDLMDGADGIGPRSRPGSGDDDEDDDVHTFGMSPDSIIDGWLDDNADRLADIHPEFIHAAVVSPEGVLTTGSFGDMTSVNPLLAWWSMTKIVTVAWMMRLVENGIVSLDDPLSRWVPEVPNASGITLEQLARHTSGIPGDLDESLFASRPDRTIENYVRNPTLEFAPGEGFSYSRTGYTLLGLALERASGVAWTDAVSNLADRAGVSVSFDDAMNPDGPVTDPDGHGYRGGLWASGGLMSTVTDAARLLHWMFTKGLTPASIDAMTRFSDDPNRWYYGLALMPVCPCTADGGWLHAERFGLDSATGTFAVSRDGAVVVIRPEKWFRGTEPVAEYYELEDRLLDSVSVSEG